MVRDISFLFCFVLCCTYCFENLYVQFSLHQWLSGYCVQAIEIVRTFCLSLHLKTFTPLLFFSALISFSQNLTSLTSLERYLLVLLMILQGKFFYPVDALLTLVNRSHCQHREWHAFQGGFHKMTLFSFCGVQSLYSFFYFLHGSQNSIYTRYLYGTCTHVTIFVYFPCLMLLMLLKGTMHSSVTNSWLGLQTD